MSFYIKCIKTEIFLFEMCGSPGNRRNWHWCYDNYKDEGQFFVVYILGCRFGFRRGGFWAALKGD